MLVVGETRANEGSLARDHLANERTFLSWVRTSLAFVGLGVLVAELVRTEGVKAEVTGLGLIALGSLALVSSTYRYLRVAALLDEGRFVSSTGVPLILGVLSLLVALGAALFILI